MAKIRVTFKTPDAVDCAIEDYVNMQEARRDHGPVETLKDLGEDMDFRDGLRESIGNAMKKFIKWGEVVTIEFDTEKGTAQVLEA